MKAKQQRRQPPPCKHAGLSPAAIRDFAAVTPRMQHCVLNTIGGLSVPRVPTWRLVATNKQRQAHRAFSRYIARIDKDSTR